MSRAPRRLLVLSDSLNPWHSFWIRFGQYAPLLHAEIQLCQQVACTSSGLQGVDNGRLLPPPDVVLLYRFGLPEAGFLTGLQQLRQRNVLLLADLDDNLWQRGSGWGRARLRNLTAALRICHTLTCSTPALRELLQVMFPAQAIRLIRNGCPAALAAESAPPRSHPGTLRLGWTGAPWTRPADLALLQPLAHWSLSQPQIRWVHLGACEGRLSFAEALGLPADRVETYPLMPYKAYLEHIHFDVGLAPLAQSAFNSFKSELKVLEYSAKGIPWLASNHGSYRDFAQGWGQQQRLCSTGQDWITGVQSLGDPAQRLQEGLALQGLLYSQRGLKGTLAAWQSLIDHTPSANKPACSS